MHIINQQTDTENQWIVARKSLEFQLTYLGYTPNHAIVDGISNHKKIEA